MLFLQNLKDVLADLIPKEQNRIKNFKQQYGKNNIGQITVDMVSRFPNGLNVQKITPQTQRFCFLAAAADFKKVKRPGTKGQTGSWVGKGRSLKGHQPSS